MSHHLLWPPLLPPENTAWRPGFIQKVESQIQEHSRTFLGEKQKFVKNISGASSAHFVYNTINRAISSRETKSLTDVGAVKNVTNGYYRQIGKVNLPREQK